MVPYRQADRQSDSYTDIKVGTLSEKHAATMLQADCLLKCST